MFIRKYVLSVTLEIKNIIERKKFSSYLIITEEIIYIFLELKTTLYLE